MAYHSDQSRENLGMDVKYLADKQIWYAVAYYSDQWELNRQRGGKSQRYAVAYYSDRWEPNEQKGGRSQRYAVAYYSDRWEPMNKEEAGRNVDPKQI